MKAHLRQARISPKKANLVAGMVRGMTVNEALGTLKRLPKKGSLLLYKTIHSAAANAEQNMNQKRDDLYIKTLIVNKGPAMQRFIPIARGRARKINKFFSHISVELGVVVPEGEKEKKKQEKEQKKIEKKVAKKDEKESETKKSAEIVHEKPAELSASPGGKGGDTQAVAGDDPHAQGSSKAQGDGPTFQSQSKGSRGS